MRQPSLNHGKPRRTAFHVMAKPSGAACNLQCAYCFYLQKESLYPNSNLRMADEVLESFIRQYITSQSTRQVNFAWQGGEPTLMGLDFFRKAVELQNRYRKPGTQITNAFQTNAILLNTEWAEFLHANQFLVGLSLDGPAHIHDHYRLDKGGAPTAEKVIRAARLLQQAQVDLNILTCINDYSARHPLEIYRFLRDEIGAEYIQFIPIVEKTAETGALTERSVSPADFGLFLKTIFAEWLRRDVGVVFVQAFDAALAAWLGQPAPICVHAPTCGNALALEHNGDVYACDHFVSPQYLLGNLMETPLGQLAGANDQFELGQAKKDSLPKACRECRFLFACQGGCPKDRTVQTAEPGRPLNYLCQGYFEFFSFVDQPMRRMTDLLRSGKPAAEIMLEPRPALRRRHPSRKRAL